MEERMNLVEKVFEIAECFMKDSQQVFLNHEEIKYVSDIMIKEGKEKFPVKDTSDVFKTCLLELVGNSINYCYWYGRHDIRPAGSSSARMYAFLEQAFSWYKNPGEPRVNNMISYSIDSFIDLLSINRFPLLEERIKHLKQLLEFGEEFIAEIIERHDDRNFDKQFERLVSLFPGYSSDIFLKRASLFFLQLYRNLGWFEESMHKLHVPADYQVPKMLNHWNCIKYSIDLIKAIKDNVLITKHTQAECEIRAATILACRELCKLTGWNIADVDGWLWLGRKRASQPFHLTITTDY
jgi:hypothetical protein